MELRYEDGWLLEMDADAGVYDVYDEKRCLLQQVTGNQLPFAFWQGQTSNALYSQRQANLCSKTAGAS